MARWLCTHTLHTYNGRSSGKGRDDGPCCLCAGGGAKRGLTHTPTRTAGCRPQRASLLLARVLFSFTLYDGLLSRGDKPAEPPRVINPAITSETVITPQGVCARTIIQPPASLTDRCIYTYTALAAVVRQPVSHHALTVPSVSHVTRPKQTPQHTHTHTGCLLSGLYIY